MQQCGNNRNHQAGDMVHADGMKYAYARNRKFGSLISNTYTSG